jgi:GcrA cell cycle regulator
MSINVVPDDLLRQAQRETGWTDTRSAVALQLWNAKVPASQIACLIGGITRNAVIGHVHRERGQPATPGNEIRAGRTTNPRTPASARLPAPRPKSGRPKTAAQKQAARSDVPPIVDTQIPVEQRKQLIDLTDACCHWPVGDPLAPEFFFCGSVDVDVVDGEADPYCKAHMRRAHQAGSANDARRTRQGGVDGQR